MSDFKAKMHQIRFSLGELTALPRPIALFKGPTFKREMGERRGRVKGRGGKKREETERGGKGGRRGLMGTYTHWDFRKSAPLAHSVDFVKMLKKYQIATYQISICQNPTTLVFGQGSTADTAGGAYDTPPHPPVNSTPPRSIESTVTYFSTN